MKHLLMIAIAFLTINATAQQTKKAAGNERMEMRKNMTPEETAQIQTKKMTLKLDLTENQQVEVEKVLLEAAKIRKSNMEEFKANKEKTGEKMSKDEHLKMANDRLDTQIDTKKKMKAILNAEQYEAFENMQEERQGMRRNVPTMKVQKD